MKRRKAGTIEPSYENIGRQSEVTQDKLAKMKALVAENPDITLAEIKESMHLSIQKSEISHILRNKLGFDIKKDVHASERDRADVKAKRNVLPGIS